MNRRSFVCLVASGLITVRLAAIAQQSAQVYRIGFLRERKLPVSDVFFDAMRKLGWIEGQNFKMDSRYADNAGQLPTLATELVQLKVDLIITNGTPATLAAKQATTKIPIVFFLAADPVQNGIVVSLARPGGNLTGFAYGLYGEKLLEVLKAALPGLSRVAVPLGGESPTISRAAKLLGVQVLDIEMRSPESSGAFFADARKAGADAALIPDVPSFTPHLRRIAAEATKSRMPSIGYSPDFAESEVLRANVPTLAAPGSSDRQDLQRREARRSACRTTDEVRARHQPKNREGAWNHHPAAATTARGRGDSVMGRCALLADRLLPCRERPRAALQRSH